MVGMLEIKAKQADRPSFAAGKNALVDGWF
jgi:hypothetical protein